MAKDENLTLEAALAEIERLKAENVRLEEVARLGGCTAQVGEDCHVINLESWKDWDGKLVEIIGDKALIEIQHTKAGRRVYSTALANVRVGKYPKKAD